MTHILNGVLAFSWRAQPKIEEAGSRNIPSGQITIIPTRVFIEVSN